MVFFGSFFTPIETSAMIRAAAVTREENTTKKITSLSVLAAGSVVFVLDEAAVEEKSTFLIVDSLPVKLLVAALKLFSVMVSMLMSLIRAYPLTLLLESPSANSI